MPSEINIRDLDAALRPSFKPGFMPLDQVAYRVVFDDQSELFLTLSPDNFELSDQPSPRPTLTIWVKDPQLLEALTARPRQRHGCLHGRDIIVAMAILCLASCSYMSFYPRTEHWLTKSQTKTFALDSSPVLEAVVSRFRGVINPNQLRAHWSQSNEPTSLGEPRTLHP